MAHYTSDTKYNREEKIVIAIDLGTTHSAVSYSYLYPDDLPQVRLVTKWPGQPEASGDSKAGAHDWQSPNSSY
ncbi:hypothetical protein FS842_006454 [Serendipita sp. 407]|nr:hypothetical protein FS842_006454 [Serendipita sp. 407]